MIADLLIEGIGQLATPADPGPARWARMGALRIVERAAIAIVAGRFAWCGPASECPYRAGSVHHCQGAAVVPALIDPHTHAVWSGNRLADFEARTAGVSYERILAAGGGIRSTIRHTAAASKDELVASAEPRIASLVRSGASTIEVKSGYGFEAAAEIRMLEAIQCLASGAAARLIPTLLIHIPPADAKKRAAYAQSVREELIPEVARRVLATAVDVFVEQEAWSAREAATFLEVAQSHGLRGKLHTEQFHRVGGLELGIEHAVQSVDHLEAAAPRNGRNLRSPAPSRPSFPASLSTSESLPLPAGS